MTAGRAAGAERADEKYNCPKHELFLGSRRWSDRGTDDDAAVAAHRYPEASRNFSWLCDYGSKNHDPYDFPRRDFPPGAPAPARRLPRHDAGLSPPRPLSPLILRFSRAPQHGQDAAPGGSRRSKMSDAFVVEIKGEQVGLAIQERGGFRFFAAAPGYYGLDGKLFASYGHARLAAIQKANSKAKLEARSVASEMTIPG
jgi:hypothetical protein